MKKIIIVLSFGLFSFFNAKPAFIHGLSYSEMQNKLAEIFTRFTDKNEGTTSFRSLLIPFGGRAESLGNAYTGLSDDLSFFIYKYIISLRGTFLQVFFQNLSPKIRIYS